MGKERGAAKAAKRSDQQDKRETSDVINAKKREYFRRK